MTEAKKANKISWPYRGDYECRDCGCTLIVVDQGISGDYLYYCAHKGCKNHEYDVFNDLGYQEDPFIEIDWIVVNE